ncbi:30S ribosomal protein S17 [Mycoplasma sp. SG1]|uniref:30S ribosomal protein S17 n=1 Tax=Mycoplasma sp. SG1 TaxID=2810348 RepID=UPI002024C83B|nr:30S ribosomal protein S17 [Mycoplasma sp. SG1]
MATAKKVHKKTLYGEVVSDKNDKTITVLVKTAKIAPYYKKRYFATKKYLVHDEKNLAKLGDFVKIIECRPLSARKRFRLLEIKTSHQLKENK